MIWKTKMIAQFASKRIFRLSFIVLVSSFPIAITGFADKPSVDKALDAISENTKIEYTMESLVRFQSTHYSIHGRRVTEAAELIVALEEYQQTQ